MGSHTEVPQRRCWRCLQMFPGDATRAPTPTPEWWLAIRVTTFCSARNVGHRHVEIPVERARRGDRGAVHDARDVDLGIRAGSSHSSTSATRATTSASASPPTPRPAASFGPDGSPSTSIPSTTPTTVGGAVTTHTGDGCHRREPRGGGPATRRGRTRQRGSRPPKLVPSGPRPTIRSARETSWFSCARQSEVLRSRPRVRFHLPGAAARTCSCTCPTSRPAARR